jgi:hypothetical protein
MIAAPMMRAAQSCGFHGHCQAWPMGATLSAMVATMVIRTPLLTGYGTVKHCCLSRSDIY